jgi:hypothetical protein
MAGPLEMKTFEPPRTLAMGGDGNGLYPHGDEIMKKVAPATALSKIKQVFGMFLFLRFSYIFLFFWHHFYFVVSSHHPCDSNLFIDLLQGVPLFWHDFILRPKSKKTCLINFRQSGTQKNTGE